MNLKSIYAVIINYVLAAMAKFEQTGSIETGELFIVTNDEEGFWAPLNFCTVEWGDWDANLLIIRDPDRKRSFWPQDMNKSWFILNNDELNEWFERMK